MVFLGLWVYLRLMVLTAGTLLPLFWMVVILGHRRQRNFERIFFFVCLALLFFFGASLLALNARLYYASVPEGLARFAWILLCLGLWFLPSLLLDLHLEYARIRGMLGASDRGRVWPAMIYLPAAALAPSLAAAMRMRASFDYETPTNALGLPFQLWFLCALIACAVWQGRFAKAAPDKEQKSFHRNLAADFAVVAVYLAVLHVTGGWFGGAPGQGPRALYTTVVAAFALAPLVALIRNVQKFNFLQIGRQQNLIYAVFVTFLALLYLSFVRRVSTWTEAYLPPEATTAILLFLPVAFFEPLQRLMRRLLRATAQTEMDRAQRLMGPILEAARLGNLGKLQSFIEGWVAEQLQLAEAKLALKAGQPTVPSREARGGSEDVFAIRQAGREIGTLRVRSHGAMLSGETFAALQFLCEQLPGAIDLCRLIEEKLQLERELAERERLALVGQTAASISHNLKNPLGSIKTILQVQLENPQMPESMRGETKMVLEEISRLSSKLNQLLQFSRPAVRGGNGAAQCDARAVMEEVAAVLRHEAERKGIVLEAALPENALRAAATAEALSDIASNLLVNALEAAPAKGRVRLQLQSANGGCLLTVEDDGPGIAPGAREKILQPFFTTKSQGTGLGLAIVARRVSESGGKLEWESPVRGGKGTRFCVTLPMGEQGFRT